MADFPIPPEVVEAMARAAYDLDAGSASDTWDSADRLCKTIYLGNARAAARAMLAAWPGAEPHKVLSVRDNGEGYSLKRIGILLPLPQEPSNG